VSTEFAGLLQVVVVLRDDGDGAGEPASCSFRSASRLLWNGIARTANLT
jgi:hypothetical protein